MGADDRLEDLVRRLGSGTLDADSQSEGLRRLRELEPERRLEVVLPYVSSPRDCDPSSLLDLMRVLVAGDETGAQAVVALADDPDTGELVREEAEAAIERERPDLVARGEHSLGLEPREETLTFHSTRFSARQFVAELQAYAFDRQIPFEAEVGSGLLFRDVDVTVTGRPDTITDLVLYARSLGRARGYEGPGPAWGGDFGGGGGGGGDGGGGGG